VELPQCPHSLILPLSTPFPLTHLFQVPAIKAPLAGIHSDWLVFNYVSVLNITLYTRSPSASLMHNKYLITTKAKSLPLDTQSSGVYEIGNYV
jgi:hypothetical protein